MAAASIRVRAVGPRTIVSYAMRVSGAGVHPFEETAFVTHVFDSPASAAAHMRSIRQCVSPREKRLSSSPSASLYDLARRAISWQ